MCFKAQIFANYWLQIKQIMSNCRPLEAMRRCSETQLQVGEMYIL